LRRVGLRELLDRGRQAVLSHLEGNPYVKKWVLPSPDNFLVDGGQCPVEFARLSELLWTRLATGVAGEGACWGPCQAEGLRRSADLALEGCFSLLGIERLQFGYPIDWHLEPRSGRRSPLVPWKQLDSLDPSRTGDKKIVWELNRHQHLLTLGRAFLTTGDDRYAAAVGEHIASWIRENPLAQGINWVSSLELAFRCMGWLWSLALIRTWNKWPSLPLHDIARALYLHGRHIERHLSTYYSPNTHLTGEALGLYYLGTCLPELKRARRWRNLGRSILLQELDRQVRPDGVYFEQSTWYHRYTTDFYMHFVLLAECAGETLPARVSKRLENLLDHLMWITRPDGTSPCLGDDDGGKLVKLEERAPNDWRAVLSSGAVMYARGDYKHVAGKCAEETCWLFGLDAKEKFEDILARPPDVTSRAFVDGGFDVMRSGWNPDANYLLIDCGPHGAMNCGHAHADALAIEVAALGATVLVDPGTYTYTGSAEFRDLFRSTAMHNCLTIDGLSSSVPAGPFKWDHVATCARHCWHDHPGFTYFEGSHDGYRRLSDPATHTRTVLFANREYWFMLDRADATGEHEYSVHFHMAPDIQATLDQENGRLEAKASTAILDIICLERLGSWHVVEDVVSPCYAAKVPAPHGTYSVRTKGPVALLSVLFPRSHGQLPPQIRNLKLSQGKGLVLATQRFRDIAVWSGSAVPEEGIHAADFDWVWVRRSPGDFLIERAVLLHGRCISTPEFEVIAERPVEFVVISVLDRVISIDVFPPVGLKIRPPNGVVSILVNGRMHALISQDTLAVPEQEVPVLVVSRDETDRCRHVRH
jgi:hypothetical protein